MARTYLQLVNDVLVRLRETQVGTNTATPYSTLVGTFINDAKREVEDAYQWTVLQDYLPYTTTAGTYQYQTNSITTARTGSPATDRARLWMDTFTNLDVHLNTSWTANSDYIYKLRYEPSLEAQQQKLTIIAQNEQLPPKTYQIVGINQASVRSGQWSVQINLYPIPDQAYAMQLYIVNPQSDLVNDTDILLVPYYPVVQRAYLMCLYERGEELGEALTLTNDRVEEALANAIAYEQNQQAQYQQFAVPYGGQY